MGGWGTRPWDNDTAADWFGNMMDNTGLAEYVVNTLKQEIDDDDPGAAADEIRAAAAVVLLLGHRFIWPVDDLETHLKFAVSRLEEILAKKQEGRAEQQIQAEITALKSRLEENVHNRPKRVKWWHFDE